MSRELDLLAREFNRAPTTVMRTELNLYQTNIQNASAAFLKKIEQEAKREKTATITLVAVIKSPLT